MGVTFCRVEDCVGRAARDGLCWAHHKRRYRGGDVRQPVREPLGTWASVVEAWHTYQDADPSDDLAFRAARLRAQRAMRAWAFAHDRRKSTCPPVMAG